MGAIGMQAIRAMIVLYHCYGSTFWWPGMISQMQQSIKNCVHCLQHEGDLPKVPLHPIVATAPLDLLHIDFTSIETTMELNWPMSSCSRTISQSILWHMWPPIRQLKWSPHFCIRGYILIFGALARFLSDWGANFMSSITDEMCMLLGMKKLQTTPYHPQTNGLVERSHQTIMQMIRKLGKEKKADWPGHLTEIVQAYNATWSTMMGYSPHYLMFGFRPRLLVDFYFPTFSSTDVPMRDASTKHVHKYVGNCPWPI